MGSTKEMANRIARKMGWEPKQTPAKVEPISRKRNRKPRSSYAVQPTEEQIEQSLDTIIDLAVHLAKRDHNSPNTASGRLLADIYLRRAHEKLKSQLG